jgi:hypothetical protein
MEDIGINVKEAFSNWTSGEIILHREIIRKVVVILLPGFVFCWVEAAV